MGFAKRYFKSKSHSCKAGGTTVVQVDLPWLFNYFTPPQSESSFLDKCPGVGKFICEIFFLGRVELRGGVKVTEQPR